MTPGVPNWRRSSRRATTAPGRTGRAETTRALRADARTNGAARRDDVRAGTNDAEMPRRTVRDRTPDIDDDGATVRLLYRNSSECITKAEAGV
ncbi:hypothetical protein [Halomicrococcus sp. NG-SE-24]|uniref:hypothetical protein n=1 Tax=Halomicrococcus sp. NG-SE-24 TaxID=3436928 RepID=UPI003D985A18